MLDLTLIVLWVGVVVGFAGLSFPDGLVALLRFTVWQASMTFSLIAWWMSI